LTATEQKMKPGVSIVVPTWNGIALLARFLPSVLAAGNRYHEISGASVEVIVVDDGSTDQTPSWLMENAFRESARRESEKADAPARDAVNTQSAGNAAPALKLELVRNEVNLGFGETCNRGFAAATQPLVFLVNNDVEVGEDAIAPLVENFAEPSVFAAHCRVFDLSTGRECGTGKVGGFSRGFIRVHQSYVPAGTDAEAGPLYSMFAGGGSAMFDRLKFREIGGFEPLLSPFYWEDVELSYRAWKRGFTVLYEPRSTTRHSLSSTIGKLKRRSVRLVEQRNRLAYHWIHLQDRGLMASHIAWVVLLAMTAPLRLNPGFIASAFAALKRLPKIRKRRLEERNSARRTDREVLTIFELLSMREDVVVYDGEQ
jgi:GT2 family glycosyltransferase